MSPQTSDHQVLKVKFKDSVGDATRANLIRPSTSNGIFSKSVECITDGSSAHLASLKRSPDPIRTTGHFVAQMAGTIDNNQDSQEVPVFEATQKIQSSVQKAQQVARRTKQTIRRTAQAVRAVVKYGARAVAAVTSNPALALWLVVMLISILILIGYNPATALPGITLKSKYSELHKTYAYITELDCNLQLRLLDYARDPDADEVNFFVNGKPVSERELLLAATTCPDPILAFLDCKYGNYTFPQVRDEVTSLHEQLYKVRTTRQEIILPDPEPDPEPDPKPEPPPRPRPPVEILSRSGTTTQEQPPPKKTYNILNVKLTAIDSEKYYTENQQILFTKEQLEAYQAITDVGVYTTYNDLGSPFVNIPWKINVSSRFGWRIHPITGTKDNHQGLDIALPEGTPINAVLSGVVEDVGTNESLGEYVVISLNKKKTIYAHCSSIVVSKGDSVLKGDTIGFVGSTGNSTGSHLHIEYITGSTHLNPAFYLYGGSTEGGDSN